MKVRERGSSRLSRTCCSEGCQSSGFSKMSQLLKAVIIFFNTIFETYSTSLPVTYSLETKQEGLFLERLNFDSLQLSPHSFLNAKVSSLDSRVSYSWESTELALRRLEMALLENPAVRQACCLSWWSGKDSSPGSREVLEVLGWAGPPASQLRKTGAPALLCLLPVLSQFPALPRENHITGEVQNLSQLTAVSSLSWGRPESTRQRC